jgi:hypothetical protein
MDDGNPYDHHFQARVACTIPTCPGPAWSPVHSIAELAAAHTGQPSNEALCDICDC